MHPSDTPTSRSCASSLGLTDIIDLSDDALFFRPPRPSTDLPSLSASPARAGPLPPRPPRRRPKPLRKVPRKPVPSFLPDIEGSNSDTAPPLCTTPSTGSDMSHQSSDTRHRSQVSLDATPPWPSSSGYFDDVPGTTTPSSKSTLSSLDAELALSTYQHLARSSSPPPKTQHYTFPYVAHRTRAAVSLDSCSSSSLPELVKGPTRVDFVNSTLLSSPGVRARGDGWMGGPQRPDPKPWFARVRRSSNASGTRDKTSVYGLGRGIEHIARTGSHPNLPSMTSSRLDLLPPTPAPFSIALGGIDESQNGSGASTNVEDGHAPAMARSGTSGTKTKIHLIKSRPDIPDRIKSLSSPRRTTFGTTYDFRQSVLRRVDRGDMTDSGENREEEMARGGNEAPTHPEPKTLPVLGRLKARMRSGSATLARPNTPASFSVGQPITVNHLSQNTRPTDNDTSAQPSRNAVTASTRPASRLSAPFNWRSTLSKLSVDKWNRLASLARNEQQSPIPQRAPSPPSPRSLAVVSMEDFLSTPHPSQSIPASLSLELPAIFESIDLDDILDSERRESIIESLRSSSTSPHSLAHSRSLSDPTSEIMIDSPSTQTLSLGTPGLDPNSPSVQSEHDTALVTPSLTEQCTYKGLLAKSGYPSNPHLRRISADGLGESEGSFYTTLEGEDVTMIHFEERA